MDVAPQAQVSGRSASQASESTARRKRTFAQVMAEHGGQSWSVVLENSRVRVLNKASRFASGTVVIDRVDRAAGTATVRLPHGQRTECLPFTDLEVIGKQSGVLEAAAEGASASRHASVGWIMCALWTASAAARLVFVASTSLCELLGTSGMRCNVTTAVTSIFTGLAPAAHGRHAWRPARASAMSGRVPSVLSRRSISAAPVNWPS